MNAKELRIEAEKNNRAVTDEGWEELADYGFVDDALGKDFDEDKVAEIIKAIDHKRAKFWPTARGVGARFSTSTADGPRSDSTVRPGPFAVDLSDAEHERALLLTDAQVSAAATDARIRGFRERHLTDGLLAPEDAELFLESGPRGIEALGTYLHEYYGWHRGEAQWWVLTGEKPSAHPVRVSYRTAETLDAPGVYLITIEAPPWISLETFQGAFAEMRRRMHAERKPPKARSLRVVRFVERLQNNPGTETLTFKELCRRWNQENPQEDFSKARTFERVYQRTANIVSRQYNTEVEHEETPELRRQRARMQKMDERFRERAEAVYAEAIETN